MANAEKMANSMRAEGHGVFVLLWDAKEDLARALLVINAALAELPKKSLLLQPEKESLASLRQLIQNRVVVTERPEIEESLIQGPDSELWLLYLQQASSKVIGPLLNGWRGPLRQSPGSLLVLRHADFEPFQRNAPDLASFVGPRIYNASTMISVVSQDVFDRLRPELPEADADILAELPGVMPPQDELVRWISACNPSLDE